MGNYLKILQLALGLVPLIVETVKSVEAAAGDQATGTGKEKAAAVIAIVRAAMEEFTPETVTGLKVEGFIQKVIDIVVSLLNRIGVFKNGK